MYQSHQGIAKFCFEGLMNVLTESHSSGFRSQWIVGSLGHRVKI